ncbi:MAG: IS5 family transposase [Sumerlaeia bacterium]
MSSHAPDRSRYDTDLTDAQWAVLWPVLRENVPQAEQRQVSYREIVNAILYQLRAGCPWRLLPHDLPKWKTVHHYFREWTKEGVWREIEHCLVRQSRKTQAKKPSPSVAVIDSQSVKTTEKGGL